MFSNVPNKTKKKKYQKRNKNRKTETKLFEQTLIDGWSVCACDAAGNVMWGKGQPMGYGFDIGKPCRQLAIR